MQSLTEQLEATRSEMRGKQITLQALEDLRSGILTGKRIELPSAQRQHLEKGSPLVNEVSFDARHRPVSTNVSRHFMRLRTLAPNVEVRFHTFMPLKRGSSSPQKGAPTALLAVVGENSKFYVFNLEGDAVLEDFDLGHAPGTKITQMVLSPNQDQHFVLTADDKGNIRVHNLKVVAKKEKEKAKEKSADADADAAPRQAKRQFTLTTNFSCEFSLADGPGGEARKLNTVLPIERGASMFFVTGDSMGGIAVFFRNGTMKGRVKVTEDPSGVTGLIRSQGQMILFWSSHTFGFFSSTQIEVQYPPCSGWNSPVFDVIQDPSSGSSRVVLALSDGDILVFSTTRGKSKACDLSLKFPHVSNVPFKLLGFRGHVMALPTPLEDTPRKEDYPREIFFFNLPAMEAGYGTAPSRAVALQASFKPKLPEQLALNGAPTGGAASGGKSNIAIRFVDTPGVELFDLSLKQPPAPKSVASGGGGGDSDPWSGSWLNWFPKVGVFGIALVGVAIWNVRKVTNQRKGDSHDSMEDFDDEFFKEKLKERRLKREKEKASGASQDGGLGDDMQSKIEAMTGEPVPEDED